VKVQKPTFVALTAIALAALWLSACSGQRSTSAAAPAPAVELPSDAATREGAIRFLEQRVKQDPDDFIAHNKLAGYYRQVLRETGDLTYLDLASRAARASLTGLPPEQNTGGLTELAAVEFASHDFAAARDHARRLIALDPGKAYPFQILGDTLLELGEYEKAEAAFRQMERWAGSIQGLTRSAIDQRRSRMAALRGNPEAARRWMTAALTAALASPAPPRETVAWCRWQLGELAFSVGEYPAAERWAREALTTFPHYFRALASLGRVRAARGDLPDAIVQYERAIRRFPDPAFVAALGDLYRLTGQEKAAAAQYALVEHIARLSAAGGALYNRPLALFYADHDLNVDQALALAQKEMEVRQDIYGYDTLAWALYKNGRYQAALAASQRAHRLGTQDASLYYHLGMVRAKLGRRSEAVAALKRALAINPCFDPLQAEQARAALKALAAEGSGSAR
jgi:tetratricopeptide (TPR) repeat protein